MGEDKWIPVDEMLPSRSGQKVIFYTKGYKVNDMRMGVFVSKDQWDRENMFIGDGYFHTENVSHWQKAPNPPTT